MCALVLHTDLLLRHFEESCQSNGTLVVVLNVEYILPVQRSQVQLYGFLPLLGAWRCFVLHFFNQSLGRQLQCHCCSPP